MTALPTDEKLIAQGPRQKGEREPGSVLEERVYAEQKVKEGFHLGQVQRTCDVCHKDWIGPAYCGQGTCRGLTFTERDVRPSPTMTILGRGLTPVEEPPKPKIAASEEDIAVLRALRVSLVDVEGRLQEAGARLAKVASVNQTNWRVFGFLSEVLDMFTSPGDFELRVFNPLKVISLLGPIRGLIAEIDRTLANYEKEAVKK